MSWLFGIIGNAVSESDIENAKRIHGKPLFTVSNRTTYYVAAGGNKYTCQSHTSPTDQNTFWIGLGCVFKDTGSRKIIFGLEEWSNASHNPEILNNCDGHYIFFNYKNNQFDIRSDSLGQRTVYWYKNKNTIVISTRLSWITRYIGGSSIQYDIFGSRWLLYNQLSYKSLVRDIERLGPNGKLVISGDTIKWSESPFLPQPPQVFSYDSIISLLRKLTMPEISEKLTMSFGISGGIDSRVLLSLLLNSPKYAFRAHTFGEAKDPDVTSAIKIQQIENFEHQIINLPLPSASNIFPVVKEFASQTNLNEPISTFLRIRHYNSLNPERLFLMDGAYGEFARRQYFKRVSLYGKRYLYKKNAAALQRFLHYNKGNIFNTEITQRMNKGITDEIQYMFDTMPPLQEMGIANYLDLWSIRARLPNFGADEQARLDEIILNYMPFTQKSFLDMLFSIPADLRANGKLFRDIIAREHPSLKNYPLVKNNTTYPFMFSAQTSIVYTKIKSMLGFVYRESGVHEFLLLMKDHIFDLVHSRMTREYDPYNYAKLLGTIEQYYAGNTALASQINWWITFELWRRDIEDVH